MRIVWDELKRQANLAKHGLDFADLNEAFFANALVIPGKNHRWRGIGANVGGHHLRGLCALRQRGHQRHQYAPSERRRKEALP